MEPAIATNEKNVLTIFDLPHLKARSLLSYFFPTVFARKGRKQYLGELVEGLWLPRNIERYWRAPHCGKKRQFK
jgi:hypothetical protein